MRAIGLLLLASLTVGCDQSIEVIFYRGSHRFSNRERRAIERIARSTAVDEATSAGLAPDITLSVEAGKK